MINHGRVQATVQPEPLVVDEFSVWIASNVTAINTEGTGDEPGFTGYEYDLVQYDKDEYIKMQSDKQADLESQILDTQEGLVEVYGLLTV